MKIRFLQTRLVKDGTGITYTKGEVYDLLQASADHWLSRGVAEKAGPASKTAKPKIVETATVRAPETTRSRNVPASDDDGPWDAKPPPPVAPLTHADIAGEEGST